MVSEDEKKRRRKEINDTLARGEAEPEPNLWDRAKSTYSKAKMYYEEHKERERQKKMVKAKERIRRYEHFDYHNCNNIKCSFLSP